MATEIALNEAQVEAIRLGYTILESVGGYYIRLENGVGYEPDHLDTDVIVLDPNEFWTIENAALETTSEHGTPVTVFYEEDGSEFHEVSMDEFDDEPTIINDDYQLGGSRISGEDSETGRKVFSHPSNMKEGLAATWSNHGLIVGIEDVVVGYGSKETTETVMDVGYGDHMGPLSGNDVGNLRGDCDGNTIDVGDHDLAAEEHLFEAWKQIDDESAKASISEALYILGYNIEATGHELVPFADE
jgi:hypothetical protein